MRIALVCEIFLRRRVKTRELDAKQPFSPTSSIWEIRDSDDKIVHLLAGELSKAKKTEHRQIASEKP